MPRPRIDSFRTVTMRRGKLFYYYILRRKRDGKEERGKRKKETRKLVEKNNNENTHIRIHRRSTDARRGHL